MAEALGTAAAESSKPVVASFLGSVLPGDRPAGDVPVFVFPEAAAHALGRVARYAEWCARQTGSVPAVEGVDVAGARERAAELVEAAPGPQTLDDALDLMAHVGVTPVRQEVVGSVDDAVAAAGAIGWPVALKALGVEQPSRTEEGGVAVDLFDEDDLRRSYGRMAALHGEAMVVQEMAPNGIDCRIEIDQHPVLGSVLGFGPALAGSLAHRILPLTDDDALDLVAHGPLADELADVAPAGRAALVELLLRLSALADAVPELAQLASGP